MKEFEKLNGINPETPFEENDVITYIDYWGLSSEIQQINIMVLDHMVQIPSHKKTEGDIYYKVMLTFTRTEVPYMMIASGDGSNYRNWFNHDVVREASHKEKNLLIEAMTGILKSGVVLHDIPINVAVQDILF